MPCASVRKPNCLTHNLENVAKILSRFLYYTFTYPLFECNYRPLLRKTLDGTLNLLNLKRAFGNNCQKFKHAQPTATAMHQQKEKCQSIILKNTAKYNKSISIYSPITLKAKFKFQKPLWIIAYVITPPLKQKDLIPYALPFYLRYDTVTFNKKPFTCNLVWNWPFIIIKSVPYFNCRSLGRSATPAIRNKLTFSWLVSWLSWLQNVKPQPYIYEFLHFEPVTIIGTFINIYWVTL